MDESDAAALSAFLCAINTSLNVQRELVEMIADISMRDDVSIRQLLDAKDLCALLNQEDIPLPARVDRLRRWFKMRRYPELSKAEADYLQARKSIKLSPHIQIQPPRFFEGNTFRLALTIRSRGELLSLIPEIKKIATDARLLPE